VGNPHRCLLPEGGGQGTATDGKSEGNPYRQEWSINGRFPQLC